MLWAEHVAKNTARARDDVFNEVKRHFTDAEFVELTGICGTFAANNRFQDSLKLPLEPQTEIDKIKHSIHADPARIRAYIEHIVRAWPEDFPIAREDAAAASTETNGGSSDLPAFVRDNRPPRLVLLDPHTAQGETARYFDFAQQLLGTVPNAVRIWAHSPYIQKLFLPFKVTLEREGAGSILGTRLKTLVRVRTSHVNRAPYSLAHGMAFGRAAGVPDDQLAALGSGEASSSPYFSPRERAALQWAEQVVPNTAKRRDDVFSTLKAHFDDAQIIELTGLCAVSNMVDLIQNALRVPLESAAEIAAMNREVRLDPQRVKRYLERLLENWPGEFPVPAD